MSNTDITYKKLVDSDLCFEDASGEHLYDSLSLDTYCEGILEDISDETDCTEFQNAYEEIIAQSKHLSVFEKDYFYMSTERIKDYIQDYATDNFSNAFDDYEVQFSDKAEDLLNQFIEELLKDNKVYTSGAKVGLIDLSDFVKEAIKDYCEENPVVH